MEIIKWLSITARYTRIYLDKELAPLNLNSSQYMYVIRVCQEPGITQDRFLKLFYVNPSNITHSLARLEKDGFIRRESYPGDRRTWRLWPTRRAIEANKKIQKIIADMEGYLTDHLDDSQTRWLREWLEDAGKKVILQTSKDFFQERG